MLLNTKDISDCIKNIANNNEKDYERVYANLERLFSCFYAYKKDIYYLGKDDIYIVNKSDLKVIINTDFKELYVKRQENKKVKFELAVDIDTIYTKIKFNKVRQIVFKGVLFDDERIEVDTYTKILYVYKKNFILINKFDTSYLTDKEKQEIISDYKEHFGNDRLKEFLDFIVACRFTGNRKTSYLYLNAVSDWGKSFLMGIFERLGIGIELEYKHFIAERPTGLNAMRLFYSPVVFLDEFTTYKPSLKRHTHKMTVEEKFESEVSIEVYAKILMSAEFSKSFTGAVEEQIKNRVIVFDIKSKKRLTDRDVYKKFGNKAYFEVVVEFLYAQIKNRFEEMLKLGRVESDKLGEKILRDLFNRYKIKEIDLETYLILFVAENIEQLLEKKNMMYQNNQDQQNNFDDLDLLKHLYIKKKDEVYIEHFDIFLEKLFEKKLEGSKKKSANYKLDSMPKVLFDVRNYSEIESRPRFGNKRLSRAVKIDTKQLKLKYLQKANRVTIDNIIVNFETISDLCTQLNILIRDSKERDDKDFIKDIEEFIFDFVLDTKFVMIYNDSNELIGVEERGALPI